MRQYISLLRNTKTVPILVLLTFGTQLVTQELQAWAPDIPDDYKYFIMPYVKQCSLSEYPQRENYNINPDGTPDYLHTTTPTRDPLKWYVNCLSYKLADSPKFIPIIFNVSIIPITYLLATALTRDKLVGLFAVTSITLNPIFTRFEGSGTYDQVWSFFLLLSVYCIIRMKDKVNLSIPFFFMSLAAKALGILYLPAWIYTLYKSSRSRRIKIIMMSCLIGGLAGIGMIFHSGFMLGGSLGYHPENIELAISQNINMLWEILQILIIAIGINRLLVPIKKVQGKGITGIWMLCGLMTTPLIYLFSDQLQFVYRFTPFVVFMSVYLGMVIVETGNKLLERKLSYKKELV